MARIDTLGHYLTDVSDAIKEKAQVVSVVPENFDAYINSFEEYDLHDFFDNDFINSGQTQSSVGFKTFLEDQYKNMQYCPIPIDLGNLTMSLEGAFNEEDVESGDPNLTAAPYFINTNGVTSTKKLFNQCHVAEFPLESDWIFPNVTDASYMFNYCFLLTGKVHIYLPSCTDVSYMFTYCTSLRHIDMREMDFSNITTYTDMFGATSGTGVPDDCFIIVKDNAAKTWITSKFSRLTNVRTVAEIEDDIPNTYDTYDYIWVSKTTGSSSEPRPSLPAGAYIGLKQYSDLSQLSYEFDFMLTENVYPSNFGLAVLGGRSASGATNSMATYITGDYKLAQHCHGIDSGKLNLTYSAGTKYRIKFENSTVSPSSLSLSENSDNITWSNNPTIPDTRFCLLNNPTPSDLSNYSANKIITTKTRVGTIKVYDINQNLINKYVPCVRKSDNLIGMYDTIEKVFYSTLSTATNHRNYATVGNTNCIYELGNW